MQDLVLPLDKVKFSIYAGVPHVLSEFAVVLKTCYVLIGELDKWENGDNVITEKDAFISTKLFMSV